MGIIYVIIANFFWATELVLVRKFFSTQNPFVVSGITCIIASLFYAPTLFVYKQRFEFKDWILLGILGFTSWFLAQLFYVTGIQKSPNAIVATLSTLTMPFFALVMSVVFLHETFTLKAILGGLCMFAGFLILSF